MPVHPELHAELSGALEFGNVAEDGRIIRAVRSTAGRWIRQATEGAQRNGTLPAGESRITRCPTATPGTC